MGDTQTYGRIIRFTLSTNGSFTTNILGVQAKDIDTASSGLVDIEWTGMASGSKATIVGTLYYLEMDKIA